jgi:RecA-family ATPase
MLRALGLDDTQIAEGAALGPVLIAAAIARKQRKQKMNGASVAASASADAADSDPLYRLLSEIGALSGMIAPDGEGYELIGCPWRDEHTGGVDTGHATYWLPCEENKGAGGYKCFHDHCASRTVKDLRAWAEAEAKKQGLAVNSIAGQAFSAVSQEDMDAAEAAAQAARQAQQAALAAVFTFTPEDDDYTIVPPPRVWLVPGVLTPGAVTLAFGPANQGKSLLMTGWAVSLALGLPTGTSFRPTRAFRVMTLFAEEDGDEQKRRFIAATLAHGVSLDKLTGQVHRLVCSGLATLLSVDNRTGDIGETLVWKAMVAEIRAFRPDVLMLDPLVELHTAEEKDNTKLKAVISKLRELAVAFGMAVVLTHHTRKGEIEPGMLEAARGASAIGGAVRVAFTVIEMTEVEAKTFGIPADRRRYYLRVDEARNAYAPPAYTADWFMKKSIRLSNGEAAGALVPWPAPVPVTPDAALVAALVRDIGQGCAAAQGQPWSPTPRDTEPRSVRQLLKAHGVMPVSEKITLDALTAAGVREAVFVDASRNKSKGLRTATGLPVAKWKDD